MMPDRIITIKVMYINWPLKTLVVLLTSSSLVFKIIYILSFNFRPYIILLESYLGSIIFIKLFLEVPVIILFLAFMILVLFEFNMQSLFYLHNKLQRTYHCCKFLLLSFLDYFRKFWMQLQLFCYTDIFQKKSLKILFEIAKEEVGLLLSMKVGKWKFFFWYCYSLYSNL